MYTIVHPCVCINVQVTCVYACVWLYFTVSLYKYLYLYVSVCVQVHAYLYTCKDMCTFTIFTCMLMCVYYTMYMLCNFFTNMWRHRHFAWSSRPWECWLVSHGNAASMPLWAAYPLVARATATKARIWIIKVQHSSAFYQDQICKTLAMKLQKAW